MGDSLLKWQILLQGIGVLVTWNSILNSLDWFNTLYPAQSVGIVFSMINFAPSLIFQPLTTWKGGNFPYNLRIAGSYIFMGGILIVLPFCAAIMPEIPGFVTVCVLIFIMGTFNAICQTSVFGLVGTLPSQYMNLVMVGNGLAGVLVSILRLVCIASFTEVQQSLLISSIIYFIISGAVLVMCIFAQLHLMKNQLVKISLAQTSSQLGDQNIKLHQIVQTDSVGSSVINGPFPWKRMFYLMWEYVFLVWLCYFITFGMLTYVAIATEAPDIPYEYFATLMILIFNVFDSIGRQTCAFKMPSRLLLWVLIFLRFLFWVTFICIASDDPSVPPSWIFSATWFKFINMAVYAFTNGYCCTTCMIYGPMTVPNYMKDKSGYTMSTALVGGIFCGSVFAFSFGNVGHMPTD